MLVLRDGGLYLYNYRSIKKDDIFTDIIIGYKIKPSVNTILKNENIEDYLKR